jgi:TRAP-type mannitol/chloroaromatic compound transport system permease large subunit
VSAELLTLLLFLSILAIFAAGVPVGLGLGAIAMFFATFTWGPQAYKLIPTTALNGISSFVLLAIPLFIFMGQILVRSGLGEAMFHAGHVLAGRLRGGLAIGVIIVCSLIGAMVGIIGAGIMTAGSVALEPMFKRGYNRYLALGMFAGGLVPAAIMIAMFVAYIGIRCWLQPEMGPALPPEERGTIRDKLVAMRDGALAFALICLVLGSILFGVATPTEAAAIGGVGAIAIALVYRRFSWGVLTEASIGAMSLTAIAVWIIIGATVFSNFHMMMGAGRLPLGRHHPDAAHHAADGLHHRRVHHRHHLRAALYADRRFARLRPDLVRYPHDPQHGDRHPDPALRIRALLPESGGAARRHHDGHLQIHRSVHHHQVRGPGHLHGLPRRDHLAAEPAVRLTAQLRQSR